MVDSRPPRPPRRSRGRRRPPRRARDRGAARVPPDRGRRRELARRARRRRGRDRAGPRPGAPALTMPARRAYSDAEVEAAIEMLADPSRLEEAQRMVGANAPGIQRILNEALQAADWFGSAHQAAVLEAAGKPDVDQRLSAVRTLIAEETGVSMLIGVAVGYELAHELMRQED